MGWSYEVETVFVAAYPKRAGGFVPSSELWKLFLEVKGPGGEGATCAEVVGRKYGPRLTGPQEREGTRSETVLTVQVPEGYGPAFVRAFAKEHPDVSWTLLPAYRDPQVVTVPVRKPRAGRFPLLG